MSKTKKNRQQALEVERVLKNIEEGLKEYQQMWTDFQKSQNNKQEQLLRAQLQKLQKLRSQVRVWYDDPNLKEFQTKLLSARQLIEAEMSRFRVSEKNLRKGNDDNDDTGPLEEALAWVNRCITNINVEITNLEEHAENRKQKKAKEEQASVYKTHLTQFEKIRDKLEEQVLRPDDIEQIRDEVDNFIYSIKDQYSTLEFDVYNDINDIIELGGHFSSDDEFKDLHNVAGAVVPLQEQSIVTEHMNKLIESTIQVTQENTQQKNVQITIQPDALPNKLTKEDKPPIQPQQQALIQLAQDNQRIHQLQQKNNNPQSQLPNQIQSQPQQQTLSTQQFTQQKDQRSASQTSQLKQQQTPNQEKKTWSLSSTQKQAINIEPHVQNPIQQTHQINKFSANTTSQVQKSKTIDPVQLYTDDDYLGFDELLNDTKISFQNKMNVEQQFLQLVELSGRFFFASNQNNQSNSYYQIQQFPCQQFEQFTENNITDVENQQQAQLKANQLNQRLKNAKEQLGINGVNSQKLMQSKQQKLVNSQKTLFEEQVSVFDQLTIDTKLYIFFHSSSALEQELAYQSLIKSGWIYNQRLNKFTHQEGARAIAYDEQTCQLAEIEIVE